MNLNIFSRSISTRTNAIMNASPQVKLYNYFKNTPHFVFMDYGFPPISRIIQFPNVRRITLIRSNNLAISQLINSNVFPNVSYIREIVDINTPRDRVLKLEEYLAHMTKYSYNTVDHEVSYLDFDNPFHMVIKKITNNFSGFDVGSEINNDLYVKYLHEYITSTYKEYMSIINSINSEDIHLLQESEEFHLQTQKVLAEHVRDEGVELR
jgi:hypothetical protein